MLLPEQLTNIKSKELKIDLEKEHFEEVNVQLSSSSDDEKQKQKPAVKPVERSVQLNQKPQDKQPKQTPATNYPPGMLLPEQLTQVKSRELKIDLEKEHFEEVNVQLSSSNDDEKPKSKSTKPKKSTKK